MVVAKVDVVHHHFELTAQDRALLLRCDAALLAVISAQLVDSD